MSIFSHVRYSSVLQTVQFEGHSFKSRTSHFSVEMCYSDMTGSHTQSEIMQYVLSKHIILSDKYLLPFPAASPPLMWESGLSSYIHTTTKPTSLCKHVLYAQTTTVHRLILPSSLCKRMSYKQISGRRFHGAQQAYSASNTGLASM